MNHKRKRPPTARAGQPPGKRRKPAEASPPRERRKVQPERVRAAVRDDPGQS
jgi:hypothetical protein